MCVEWGWHIYNIVESESDPLTRRAIDLFKKEPLKGNSEVHLHTPTKFGEDRSKDLGGDREQTDRQTDKRCSIYSMIYLQYYLRRDFMLKGDQAMVGCFDIFTQKQSLNISEVRLWIPSTVWSILSENWKELSANCRQDSSLPPYGIVRYVWVSLKRSRLGDHWKLIIIKLM